MNDLAKELNNLLSGTAAFELLSDFGKRIFFPKGIVSQSAEAKNDAKRFNATIGMAYKDGNPIEFSTIKNHIQGLSPTETVSYAPTPGLPELRKLWKQEIIKKNPGINNDLISMPVITSGLTHGISQIASLFINENDNVVSPDMFWGNYKLIFQERIGANIKSFPFFKNDKLNIAGYRETMRNSANGKKIIMIANFPNNPTGYSPTKDEVGQLTADMKGLADEGYKILVIVDDAYFGLFYENDIYKESLFSSLSGLHRNIFAVKIDGATKEDFLWGFRIGFVTFGSKDMTKAQYEALTKKLAGAIRSSISSSSRPGQSLLIKSMMSSSYYREKEEYGEVLKKRYNTVRKILENQSKGLALKPFPFNSGYFMSFKFEGGSAEKLRKELLQKEGIGTISIEDKYLRIAYSSVETENLKELYNIVFAAADRLTGSAEY